MAERPGGFEMGDFEAGFRLLASDDDLFGAFDEYPVLQAPLFHSNLRTRLAATCQSAEDASRLVLRCKDLFRALHERAHERFLTYSSKSLGNGIPAEIPSFYFDEIQSRLFGRVPGRPTRVLNPALHDREIERVMNSLGSDNAHPPLQYEDTPGVSRVALVVSCPCCLGQRLIVHAMYLDLRVRSDLRDTVLRSSITSHPCPVCGLNVCRPDFVWACEAIEVPDPLGALASIVQFADDFIVYCPPAGTVWEADLERVIEYRADELFRQVGTPRSVNNLDSRAATVYGYAYNSEELAGLVAFVESNDPVPREMRIMAMDFARRLENGHVSPAELEQHIEQMGDRIPKDWPAVLAGELLPHRPHLALSCCLLSEVCARLQDEPPEVRADIARDVARSYLALGEDALAEVALTRSADLVDQVQAAERVGVRKRELAVARAEILAKRGDFEAGAALLVEFGTGDEDDSLLARTSRSQRKAYRAFTLYRSNRDDEAFELFVVVTSELRRIIEEASGQSDHSIAPILVSAQQSLSSALANWAGLLMKLAWYLRTFRSRARIEDTRSREWTNKYGRLDAALEMYFGHFSGNLDGTPPNISTAIAETAKYLVEQAMPLSEAAQSLNNLGCQAFRLAEISQFLGDNDNAALLMGKAKTFADQAGEVEISIATRWFFAVTALGDGNPTQALALVREAARELMRNLVRHGHLATDDDMNLNFARLALECALRGAPQDEAIVLAESLRAISLSVSLERGLAFLTNSSAPDVVTRLRSLRIARERLIERSRLDIHLAKQFTENLAILNDAIERLSHDSYMRDPRYRAWCDGAALDVSRLDGFQEALSVRGLTYAGYFPTDQGIIVYCIEDTGSLVERIQWPRIRETTGTQLPYGSDVHWFKEDGRAPNDDVLDTDKLNLWGAALLGPLRTRLQSMTSTNTLILGATSPLNGLPFAALPLDGKCLCEWVRIAHVQSIGVFEALFGRDSKPITKLLCMANPTLDLNGAEQEAQLIGALCTEVGVEATSVSGVGADPATFERLASDADVIHFACHCGPESEGSAMTALHLAPTGLDDGMLSSARILKETSLNPGCFVNLAACHSASQVEVVGPTAGGLVQAFLIKGANHVLASYWVVYDDAASIFAREFYRRLFVSNDPISSLADVQRSCIAGSLGTRMSENRVWANYAIYGIGFGS